jgi:2-polyprenyl-6-methoxyphenol hydroxylase-like FAD-dependent oxidoreductase
MARILVVGGSLGGLAAANLLHRAGHEVTVLERSPRALSGRGAGIVTHEGLRSALRTCGATVDDTLGVQVHERVVLDAHGHAECRWTHPQILTSWGRLYALLREALPAARYRLDAPVAGTTQDEGSARVLLSGGEALTADLVIAADGIRSTLRTQLLPQAQPQYVGYVAWRGLTDEAVLSRRTRDTLFPHFGFGLPEGEQMLGYPVAGPEDSVHAGARRWNFVWYRPAAAGAALDALMTDADGVHHLDGIPPHQVSWRQVAAVRAVARSTLAPQFAEIVEKCAMPFLQPIFDLVSPQLAHGRVALLGDAAFVARPHVGMGVMKAVDDAVALADAVARHGATPAALRAYAAQRRPEALAVVQRARALGAYLEARAGGHAARRNPDGVMHQTAIDPALFATYPPEALAA